MTTGMLIDGIFASEAIDSSGEILNVEGCDISDLEEGRGLANWEHRGDDAPGASGLDIVGKIVYARKIFGRDDCEDDRQRQYWDKVKLPFIYGIVRLYDGAGHEGAKALAAQVRDHVANGEPVLVRFSIEGSTLDKKGNRLERCVARRVALTVKPCNRTCDSGLVADPHAPEGFKKEPEKNAKDVIKDIIDAKKSEFQHPMYSKLGGSTETETHLHTQHELVKSLVKAKLKAALLEKAITAGSTNAAPSTLTGGPALQREDLGRKRLLNTAKAALRDYDEDKHGDFKAYLKHQLPEAAEGFIDHFADLVNDYRAKIRKNQGEHDDLVDDIWGGDEQAPAPEPEPAPKKGKKSKEPAPPTNVRPWPVGPVDRSKLPGKKGALINCAFHVETGADGKPIGRLYSEKGTFTMNTDDTHWKALLPDPNISHEQLQALPEEHPHRRFVEMFDAIHNNWRITHELLKRGVQIPTIRLLSSLNAIYSANEQVPVQELGVSHTMEVMHSMGKDYSKEPPTADEESKILDAFASGKAPGIIPGWYEEPKWSAGARLKPDPKKGEEVLDMPFRAVGKPIEKLSGLHFYHRLDGHIESLLKEHGTDGRSIVRKLLEAKENYEAFKAKQRRLRDKQLTPAMTKKIDALKAKLIARGVAKNGEQWNKEMDRLRGKLGVPRWGTREEKAQYDGPITEGLASKTFRYGVSMMGAGNMHVPDTHYIRDAFGCDPTHVKPISDLKSILLNPANRHILEQVDDFHRDNHPAAKWVQARYFNGQNHPDSTFLGFWAHWVNIVPHERAQGLRTDEEEASNEGGSHAIFHRILADRMKEHGIPGWDKFIYKFEETLPRSIVERVHDAMEDIRTAHGENHALLAYWLKLNPVLVQAARSHSIQPEVLQEPQVTVAKMEALSVELRKAADGLGERAVPEHVVDSDVHSHEVFPLADEQKKLVHGLSVHSNNEVKKPAHAAAGGVRWYRGTDGSPVVVKRGDEAHNEAVFYHTARDFFGLGNYLPTTAAIQHPVHGVPASVQAMVTNASHLEKDEDGRPHHHHHQVIESLGASGELDKLAIMDNVLANGDRHKYNYLFTSEEPRLKLIDHGYTLMNWGSDGWEPDGPHYIRTYGDIMASHHGIPVEKTSVHPEAAKWAAGLDPIALEMKLLSHGIPSRQAYAARERLARIQHRLKQKGATRGSVYLHSFGEL